MVNCAVSILSDDMNFEAMNTMIKVKAIDHAIVGNDIHVMPSKIILTISAGSMKGEIIRKMTCADKGKVWRSANINIIAGMNTMKERKPT